VNEEPQSRATRLALKEIKYVRPGRDLREPTMATVTRRPGLRGVDKKQDNLLDNRQGAYDPVSKVDAADHSEQTAHERAQPGADVRGKPVPTTTGYAGALPEGLKRRRKGPLNKTTGRR
jgi:hypothetical protein